MTEKIPRKRGIYLLPSVLTTFGMFAGFYSIISSINGEFTIAAISIMIAMMWDTLDGRVARLTNTQSAFGAEYDSLADLVSFGLAPALLVYEWSLYELGRFGWLAAFVYLACAALRLARFNTQVGIADKRFFQGLPSPAAAGVIASMIWLKIWTFASFDSEVISLGYYLGAGITILCGILMVSNVRYYSFKELDSKKASFRFLLLIVLSLIILMYKPNIILFTGFFLYLLSGPFITITGLNKRRIEKKQSKGS
ncbi:CDP-diacylglycerol--serine O-phosphatidyltransferase [Candidatus Pseudothioglobus singularis]|jgi:CDP-diacylglycerol--serine O-phosphatidyltransferase|nr:CDP-diacylglycerol--serine O-phosphatidyltransferase [Candidatus Pseudothioglobus singularis]MDA9801002.1 CDP-diacylglycerol--serine O-phosphatidyltransferase [Candidatus Pseudothioglobus singularis]MDC0470124.1 CDP-diacylglycerol--serine O-phosphatidyltransferase [Candidatus Pseudothioglobus singularis]MDG1956389.1 CDP-diacylglycerol--serine O-phosphatidyltransferase [Candidatus Thioglobus sp.]